MSRPAAADELIEAYGFLRKVEHRLQMVDDRQTHSLPNDEAGVAAHRHASWAIPIRSPSRRTCSTARTASKATTPACSRRRRASPVRAATWCSPAPTTIRARWRRLQTLGFRDPSAAAGIVRRWHHGRYRSTATARARELLAELMPGLLKALGSTAAPDQALLNSTSSWSNT